MFWVNLYFMLRVLAILFITILLGGMVIVLIIQEVRDSKKIKKEKEESDAENK